MVHGGQVSKVIDYDNFLMQSPLVLKVQDRKVSPSTKPIKGNAQPLEDIFLFTTSS